MESMNKFKALTVIIVCMFVFVIAAIYSNTKDVATSKALPTSKPLSTDYKQRAGVDNGNVSTVYLEQQFNFLNKRVDELSDKVSNSESLKCKVIGVYTPDGIEKLSQNSAIEEARDYGYDLVITCSF
jgi:hypothetical protein